MYTWGRAMYFSKNRGHRIITFDQAHRHDEEPGRVHRAIVPRAARKPVDSGPVIPSQALPPETQQAR
jgi:hypothetical protein